MMERQGRAHRARGGSLRSRCSWTSATQYRTTGISTPVHCGAESAVYTRLQPSAAATTGDPACIEMQLGQESEGAKPSLLAHASCHDFDGSATCCLISNACQSLPRHENPISVKAKMGSTTLGNRCRTWKRMPRPGLHAAQKPSQLHAASARPHKLNACHREWRSRHAMQIDLRTAFLPVGKCVWRPGLPGIPFAAYWPFA